MSVSQVSLLSRKSLARDYRPQQMLHVNAGIHSPSADFNTYLGVSSPVCRGLVSYPRTHSSVVIHHLSWLILQGVDKWSTIWTTFQGWLLAMNSTTSSTVLMLAATSSSISICSVNRTREEPQCTAARISDNDSAFLKDDMIWHEMTPPHAMGSCSYIKRRGQVNLLHQPVCPYPDTCKRYRILELSDGTH